MQQAQDLQGHPVQEDAGEETSELLQRKLLKFPAFILCAPSPPKKGARKEALQPQAAGIWGADKASAEEEGKDNKEGEKEGSRKRTFFKCTIFVF